ncbi:MAG: LD-carboxypeptidase [Woeseia sp.]
MNRRKVLQTLVTTAVAGSSGIALAQQATGDNANKRQANPVKPRRLKKGDTIGLISPASNTQTNEDIRFASEIIESLGFTVRMGQHLFERNQYLAGTDQQRADDVNRMFADNSIDGIFCLRGGYGTPRILPYLDYDVIASNPKVLLGYSDITALHTAIYVKTGQVGFHGPIAGQTYTDYTLQEFEKVVREPGDTTIIGNAPPFEAGPGKVERENRVTYFVGGKARGRLIGGNLSLLATLIGTPYEPDFRDKILFLEDVGEAPYRIDRMLTQLWLAGRLQQVAGLAFGKFTDVPSASGNSYSVEEVLRQRCEPLGVPFIGGLMIGHVSDQTVVPIGINAELDADSGTLRLLERAVS